MVVAAHNCYRIRYSYREDQKIGLSYRADHIENSEIIDTQTSNTFTSHSTTLKFGLDFKIGMKLAISGINIKSIYDQHVYKFS